jgi:WD40 repeat protein
VTDTGSYQRVDLIDLESGAARQVPGLPGGALTPLSPPSALAFMPDGTLVVGTTGDKLAIVDPALGEITKTIPVPAVSANVAMAATGDGRIVTAGERELLAVDGSTGALLWRRTFETAQPTPCAWIAIAEPTSTVYCADLSGGIEERSLETGEPTGRRLDPQLGMVGPITVSTDGRELFAIGAGSTAISRWRLDGTGLITRMIARGSAAMAGYGPDGTSIITAKRLAGTTQAGELTEYSIWDPTQDREQLRVPGTAVDVGWAGPDAIIGLFDAIDRVGFLDASSGEQVPGDPVDLTMRHSWLLASGTRLYAADATGRVAVYDGRTHRRIEPTLQFDGEVQTISGTEDESLLAVTVSKDGRSTTQLVDGRTGTVLSPELNGPGLTILAGRGELIAGDENRLVRHDVPSLATSGSLPGVQGGLSNLQVSADGKLLLAGANDETVALYDLDAGIRLGDPIPTSSPLITSAYLRPDGLELLVNEKDGVAVWDLEPDQQAAAACRMAGRDLTREEWSTYFAGTGTYHSTCGFSD